MRANGLVGHDGLTDTVFSVVVHVLIESIEVVAVVASRAVVGMVLRSFAVLMRDALFADVREARWAVAVHLLDVIVVAVVTVAVPQVAPAAATATVPPVVYLVFIHFIRLNIVATLLRLLIILLRGFVCNIFLLILTANIVWALIFILLVEIVE